MYVITYPCPNLSKSVFVKVVPGKHRHTICEFTHLDCPLIVMKLVQVTGGFWGYADNADEEAGVWNTAYTVIPVSMHTSSSPQQCLHHLSPSSIQGSHISSGNSEFGLGLLGLGLLGPSDDIISYHI